MECQIEYGQICSCVVYVKLIASRALRVSRPAKGKLRCGKERRMCEDLRSRDHSMHHSLQPKLGTLASMEQATSGVG